MNMSGSKKDYPPTPEGFRRVFSKTITVKGITRRHPTSVFSWLEPIGDSIA